MYNLLVKLMLIVAITQAGLSIWKVTTCHSRACTLELEKASRDALHVDWKPISVFPEEAKRFR